MQPDSVGVPGGPCPCEGTPHPDGETVYLRTKLGLGGGTALQRLVVEANQDRADNADLTGRLAEAYLRVGVVGWTFVDQRGRPIPVTPESLQRLLLDDFERAAPIADKADDLYMGTVLAPLVKRVSESSSSSTTNGSTSHKPGGRSKPRKPSRRSSTSTTQTDDTAMTSP